MDHVRVAAAVSRGGLYYHYANTEEILLDALACERQHDIDATDISSFLTEQRNTLLIIEDTLRPTTYEYVLGLPPDRRKPLLEAQFLDAETAIIGMLTHIKSEDRRAYLARHTVRRLEGLSLAAMAATIDRTDLEQEFIDLGTLLEPGAAGEYRETSGTPVDY